MTVRIPFFGEIQVETPFLFQVQLQSDPLHFLGGEISKDINQKIKIIPQTSLVSMPELKLTRMQDKETYHLNFTLSDIPHFMIPAQLGNSQNGFWMSIILNNAKNADVQEGMLESFLALNSNSQEGYLWAELNNFLNLESLLSFSFKNGQKISGSLDLNRFIDGNTEEFTINASLDQFDAKDSVQHSLIDQFKFRFLVNDESGFLEQEIHVNAKQFHLGELQLMSPQIFTKYSERPNEDGSKEWKIEALNISANLGKFSLKSAGYFRGPLQIKTNKPLKLMLDPLTHQISLSPLDLSFDFKRITIPALAQFTQRAISGIDLDGKIKGNWSFNHETFAGKGRIVILGDKEGDIHLRGIRGRRLEAPINPEDPRRLYETPLLANTRFLITHIAAFDPQKEQIQGHFHLSTFVDWLALSVFGIQWNQHDEFIFDFDHLPYSLEGYHQKIREFFRHVASEKRKERNP